MTVLEGYGLTETTAAATLNTPEHQRVGSVGRPIPGCGVRIADDGEVLLTGPHVFVGYWHDDEATAAAFDADGWFRTGDLGGLDEDGYLTITGRKKEIIVTSAGKNVAPAPLEDAIRAHPLVSQCIVVGDERPYVAALITLDAEALPAWLTGQHRSPDTARPSSSTTARCGRPCPPPSTGPTPPSPRPRRSSGSRSCRSTSPRRPDT